MAPKPGALPGATGPSPAAPDAAPPPRPMRLEVDGSLPGPSAGGFALDPRGLLGLQRAVGNRAVVAALSRSVQRVPVKASGGETLYNAESAGGQATAGHYGGMKSFDLSRSGDASVTATVRVKFLSQTRCSDPAAAGVPAGTKKGQLYGPRTAIADASVRDWAVSTMDAALAKWQNRLTFVGEEPGENGAPATPKRLPVTFSAVKLWGVDDEADSTVIVHPPGVVGGSPGNPIDAGNFYVNKDKEVYPSDDAVIYAHEYGHLIGIPDEYSQSNEQMNALLHQAAPGNAASSMAALDKASIGLMALAALTGPLVAQLDAAMAPVVDGFRAMRPLVKTKMAKAAREGATAATVRQELLGLLQGTSEARVAPAAPAAVAFETTTNFSNKSLSAEGVEAGFTAASLGQQLHDGYEKALKAPQDQSVDVTGLGKVKVEVSSSVYGASGAGTPTAGNASSAAAAKVGPAAVPGLPPVAPSGSLVGKLNSLPATWAAAGSALEASVSPAAFSAAMADAIKGIGAAVAAQEQAGTPTKKADSVRLLYQRALNVVTIAAHNASRQVARDLVAATITPTLTSSVADLQGEITAEVDRVTSASPSALAAMPPDPNMAAVVGAMKGKLDADKKATAGTGRDPLGKPGAVAPDQSVTYSYEGLMGTNATTALRADQFATLVQGFNDKLKKPTESAFKAEVK